MTEEEKQKLAESRNRAREQRRTHGQAGHECDKYCTTAPRSTQAKPAAPAATPIASGDDDDEETPLVTPPKETPKKPGGRKRSARITEEAAGKLCEGMFLIAAVMSGEEEWLLTDTQRRALGGPLADTMEVIPSPIATAINDYAAPGVFATTLFGVIVQKQRAIAAKKTRPPAVRPGQAPPRSPAAPPVDHPIAAPADRGPVVNPPIDMKKAVDAAADARSALADMDASETGELDIVA